MWELKDGVVPNSLRNNDEDTAQSKSVTTYSHFSGIYVHELHQCHLLVCTFYVTKGKYRLGCGL